MNGTSETPVPGLQLIAPCFVDTAVQQASKKGEKEKLAEPRRLLVEPQRKNSSCIHVHLTVSDQQEPHPQSPSQSFPLSSPYSFHMILSSLD